MHMLDKFYPHIHLSLMHERSEIRSGKERILIDDTNYPCCHVNQNYSNHLTVKCVSGPLTCIAVVSIKVLFSYVLHWTTDLPQAPHIRWCLMTHASAIGMQAFFAIVVGLMLNAVKQSQVELFIYDIFNSFIHEEDLLQPMQIIRGSLSVMESLYPASNRVRRGKPEQHLRCHYIYLHSDQENEHRLWQHLIIDINFGDIIISFLDTSFEQELYIFL
ncbi:hypothetical protein ACJX0J_025063 [Zea mays]